jgi:hypothetical protein
VKHKQLFKRISSTYTDVEDENNLVSRAVFVSIFKGKGICMKSRSELLLGFCGGCSGMGLSLFSFVLFFKAEFLNLLKSL